MTSRHRTARWVRPLAALATAALLASACSSSSASSSPGSADGDGAEDTPGAARTATVTRADVVGVLTLSGVVAQGAQVDVHSPVAGTVSAVSTGKDGSVALDADGGPTVVAVPAGARVDEVLVGVGSRVEAGMAVSRVTLGGFAVVANLEPTDLLRFVARPLGARAQVDGGPGPFDCPLADPVPTARAGDGAQTTAAVVTCTVPDRTAVLAGMTATVVVQLERADDALTLPVEAVAGTVDSGAVYLRSDDGGAREVPVGLGTTDGVRIVITSGLAEGDVVLVPGPWLADRAG